MNRIPIGQSGVIASEIALGCMRISDMTLSEADAHIKTALDVGIDFFDHADIYGDGKAEAIFGDVLSANPGLREKMYIQSKCGICEGYFDFSEAHIIESVEGSLKRLKTDYLDFLLLHRPDALVEPCEVAAAFDALHSSGKVRHFGVSNQNPGQITLLQKSLSQKIAANQLQYSITNATMVSTGINVNMECESAVDRDGGVLDFCRLNDITVQPWSPFQYGFFDGVFLDNAKFPELNAAIDALAKQYNVTNSAIAIAWILRHPANMQPIIGTANPKRVREIAKASDIYLTRPEWYAIYRAAGNILP